MNPIVNPFVNQKEIISKAKASRFFSPLIVEGGALGIYGERGMGKTLMLNFIANPPSEWQEEYFHNHIFILLNCQDMIEPKTSNSFWFQITKQLESKLEINPIKDKCQALLVRLDENINIDHNDFHEVLDVAAGASKRIVLVLDDFDCMIRTDPDNQQNTRIFLQGFRSLTTRDSNKANIVIATRYSLQDLCKPLSAPNYSEFYNGFTNYRLGFFSEKDLLRFLEQVEQSSISNFTDAEIRRIAQLSCYHPKLTRLAAIEIFDRRMELGSPIDDFTDIIERFKSESRGVFEGLWFGTSEIEKVLLMLISLQKLQGKINKVQYELSDLEIVFSQRDRELLELNQRGLLKRSQINFNEWEIFSPIFEWWILKEIESTEPEQLSERRKVWANLVTQKRADQLGSLVEFLKQNRENIEAFGRTIFEIFGDDLPQLPGN